jgi:prevent-host-death family protein
MTRTRTWALQDAKARFSEVVRKAKSEGPQRITVHGREEVVLVSIEEYRRMKGEGTGSAIVAAFRNSPFKEIDLEPPRVRSRVRPVKL